MLDTKGEKEPNYPLPNENTLGRHRKAVRMLEQAETLYLGSLTNPHCPGNT